jgi:hypothetical protein
MAYDTSYMQLTPQEIEDLRREMREDYQWMKEQLRKERKQQEKQEQNSDGVR